MDTHARLRQRVDQELDDVLGTLQLVRGDDLGKMVVSRVQMIDGITRTLTCPVVHL